MSSLSDMTLDEEKRLKDIKHSSNVYKLINDIKIKIFDDDNKFNEWVVKDKVITNDDNIK